MTRKQQLSIRQCIAIGMIAGAAPVLYRSLSPSIGVLPALGIVVLAGALCGLAVRIGALLLKQNRAS